MRVKSPKIESFTLRFYAVREEKSRTGMQAGPTRQFETLGELDDFMVRLSGEARAIAWVTWPDGKEAKYAEPNPQTPTPPRSA